MVCADRLPAVGDRIGETAGLHGSRRLPTSIRPEEGLALRVEPGQRFGAGEVGEVIAALAVLGLVIDHTVIDLDLADGKIALEVGEVVPCVPKAELDGG